MVKFELFQKVKVVSNGRYMHRTGTIVAIDPDRYAESVYVIAYTDFAPHKGIFLESELVLCDDQPTTSDPGGLK